MYIYIRAISSCQIDGIMSFHPGRTVCNRSSLKIISGLHERLIKGMESGHMWPWK